MGGFASTTVDAPVTPDRHVRIRLDVDDPVVQELPFIVQRSGGRIVPQRKVGTGAPHTSGVHQLGSGAWVLDDMSREPGRLHETTAGQAGVYGATDLQLGPNIVTRNQHRTESLAGVTYDSKVGGTDTFFTKSVQAGSSWNSHLATDAAAYPSEGGVGTVLTEATAAPIDRVAISKTSEPNNQGFLFRFHVPGTAWQNGDVVARLLFGGELNGYGQGQYLLTLTGGGMAVLFEKTALTDGGERSWRLVESWRWSSPDRVAGTFNSVRILPHVGPTGRSHIEFRFSLGDRNTSYGGGSIVSRALQVALADPTVHTVAVSNPPRGASRLAATGSGPLRIEMRRDVRAMWQPSKLRYLTEGTLVDAPFMLPFPITPRSNFKLQWDAVAATGESVEGFLYDADTHAELTEVSRTSGQAVYEPTYLGQHYYAAFVLQGPGTSTPTFWGYRVLRDGWIGNASPGEIIIDPDTNNAVRHVSITQAETDPSTESASFTMHDLLNSQTRLRNRGSIATVIETRYDPLDPDKWCGLFRGYTDRSTFQRKGKTGTSWPNPKWSLIETSCVGMWQRLSEQFVMNELSLYEVELKGPNDELIGLKVTDMLKLAFQYCGFPTTMIDVPDIDIRFFVAPGGNSENMRIEPGVQWAEWITKTVKQYLGGWVHFDPNAGTYGKWMVRQHPLAPYTSLATFTTDEPAAGRLVHMLPAYGDDTAFIDKGSLRSYTRRPEANLVVVYGGSVREAASKRLTAMIPNPKSYNCFTDEDGVEIETADDPDHPDYLGRCVPIHITDFTLDNQDAVNFVARRVYDVSCHGTKVLNFTAPLLLIDHEEGGGKKRPVRFYDPVTVIDNGVSATYLVRSCNANWSKDHIQMADYELESPRI